MVEILDYFFGAYVTPQEQRLRSVARNGVEHASEISPRDPEPEQDVALLITTDASLPIDRVAVYYTTNGGEPFGGFGQAGQGQVVYAQMEPGDDQDAEQRVGETPVCRWRAVIPGQPDATLVRYRIDAWSGVDTSRRWTADASDPFAAPTRDGREFAYHVDRREPPDWLHDAIVYHIFVDRFATASDQPPLRKPDTLTEFYGGTIRGITEKLDYFTELGVNCLWLSPVMDSPTYHSYNPTSYHQVSRRFGANDDLRALITAAHARGMRVLLDFVANHTSNEHPAFLAARQGDAKHTREWYTFGPSYRNGYLTFYDVEGMPVLKTEAPAVRHYLIEAARYWLHDLGADGLRLDNVSGPTHAFWTVFQEGVKRASPDAVTLGEISGDMNDIATYSGRLDAAMDFPLTKQMRRVFAQGEAPLDELLAMIEAHEATFPAHMARARLLDNHDMHRFLWLAKNDTRRLKLALAFLMVAPGFPIVYYGTEVGLSQRDGPPGQDAYAREPMPWGDDQRADLLAHTRWLIGQRAARVSLRRGALARILLTQTTGAERQVGALARWTDDEAMLIVFNNGDQSASFALERQALPFADALWRASAAQTWLLTPDGITSLDTTSPATPSREPIHLAGTLPPLSATMFLWQATSRESRPTVE